MNQARLILCLWLGILAVGPASCQQGGPLQGTITKSEEKQSTADKEQDEADAERVTPPSNIIGSYLVCVEQEQLVNLQQTAVMNCGVYKEPAKSLARVSKLEQWILQSPGATIRSLATDSASQVEVRFQAADETALKLAVKNAKLLVRDDSGQTFAGAVSDLLPADSRLSTVNASKAPTFLSVWNEGFESMPIATDNELWFDATTFVSSGALDWANPPAQNVECGLAIIEVMRFATQGGSLDSIGAAEGAHFVDTDSACWPETFASPIRGPSNMSFRKDLQLVAGRVYRISFKVRDQPLPPGYNPVVQGLQLKINQTVVKDLRIFTSTWQEISFEWVASGGINTITWNDIGASNDSIGVLLDDLRLQIGNF